MAISDKTEIIPQSITPNTSGFNPTSFMDAMESDEPIKNSVATNRDFEILKNVALIFIG